MLADLLAFPRIVDAALLFGELHVAKIPHVTTRQINLQISAQGGALESSCRVD
jgi:hypothetical protein